jgi:c-di-GMP-binding flagellar brake protein YcgR
VGGTEGKLTTSAGSHIPVRVFERGGDFLMLVLMLDDGEELGEDGADALELEYVTPRGVVRFRGEATLQERDLVRFEVSAAPEVTQRREFVRVPSLQNVVLGDDPSAGKIVTKAVDLSGGGMLLSRAGGLELDSVIRFRLDLGQHVGEIEGRARVVRSDREGRRALVFEEISKRDRERLIHFVFERQRDALAKLGRVINHHRRIG